MNNNIIRIGTRKSRLALIQTGLVAKQIESLYPEIKTELVPISTKGDLISDKPLSQLGGKGLFTQEIENALNYKIIDLAVHSAKDMPILAKNGLNTIPVLKREEVCDVVLSLKNIDLKDFQRGSVIGTGSLRREHFARLINPEITAKPIRGNVITRLEKLESGEYDAVILAAAGLNRLYKEIGEELFYTKKTKSKLRFRIEKMNPEFFLPAAAQGILAAQYTAANDPVHKILINLSDQDCTLAYNVEREFLKNIGADCNALYGIYCKTDNSDEVRIYSAYGIGQIKTLNLKVKRKKAIEAAKQMAIRLKNQINI